MKVGDYVRTKRGEIHKISDLKGHYENGKLIVEKQLVYIDNKCSGWNYEQFNEIIIKSSPNIIDLIKENDFVKIEYFSNRYEKRVTRWFEVDYVLNGDFCFENGYCRLNILNGKWARQDELLTPIIKSIVTKEQFESMEYRIGE